MSCTLLFIVPPVHSLLKQVRGMKPNELLLSSWLRLTVVYRWHLNTLSSLLSFARTFGASMKIISRIAFIFAQIIIALLSSQYFMAVEILPFGKQGPNPTFEVTAQKWRSTSTPLDRLLSGILNGRNESIALLAEYRVSGSAVQIDRRRERKNKMWQTDMLCQLNFGLLHIMRN